jgi:hypothetical protein
MFLQGLIPLSGALAPIRSQLSLIVKPETVPLAEARGRILARDIIAGVNLPSSLRAESEAIHQPVQSLRVDCFGPRCGPRNDGHRQLATLAETSTGCSR